MTATDWPNATMVLRLAGPLQAWGSSSRFNRRETGTEPTKSGIVGLLAAASGRRRADPIEDLVGLQLAIRTDQPGTVLRDYHTVSDYWGEPLKSSNVNAKGQQKFTSPPKFTHVTQRFYLQDAVFVAAIGGAASLIEGLAHSLQHPAFPLALGRRSCVPTQPLLLRPPADQGLSGSASVWQGSPVDVLGCVPWQASRRHVEAFGRSTARASRIDVPVVADDPAGDDIRADLPVSFVPTERAFTTRRVRNLWVSLATPFQDAPREVHDPFALLGW